MPDGLALKLRSDGDHVRVVDCHPRHVDRGGQDRDPPDHRKLLVRQKRRKAPQQVGENEAKNVEGEQANDEDRPLRNIEEAEQQADEQPREKWRTYSAIIMGAEQRSESKQLDGNQRRELQIAARPVDERKRPEQPDTDDYGPAGGAAVRVAEIEKQPDGLRKQRPEQVREYEVLRESPLGALELGFRRNK